VKKRWRELLDGLGELVLPPGCNECGAAPRPVEDPALSASLCAACDDRIERLETQGCCICQRPLEPKNPSDRCIACSFIRSPLSGCLAAAVFQTEVETWTRGFKYPRTTGLAGLSPGPAAIVMELMREIAAHAPWPDPDLIIPIPLHPQRLRSRGFNPAALLSREVACVRPGNVDPRRLERVRDTPSQTGLDRRARLRNISKAFRLRRSDPLPDVVWIVDDVVTTGSTLTEAARCLRAGGARQIYAVCIARTPAPFE
jgi:ComF family protein